jgi:hypothetical protein
MYDAETVELEKQVAAAQLAKECLLLRKRIERFQTEAKRASINPFLFHLDYEFCLLLPNSLEMSVDFVLFSLVLYGCLLFTDTLFHYNNIYFVHH